MSAEAAAPICFVTTEIFPGTAGGIGRLLQEIVHDLDRAGRSTVILLEGPEDAVDEFRAYARRTFTHVACASVDELLADVTPDEDIPLWAFHFAAYHRAHRVALALRRLLASGRLAGVEFPDYGGLGYVALKWRRLWGDEFAAVPMWVRIHGTHELWQAADDQADDRVETQQLRAMERYALRHADGWVGPSDDVLAWLRGVYGLDRPGWAAPPPFARLGTGGVHPRTLDRSRPVRLLFYGKLQRLKGTDTFVAAAVELCRRRPERLEFDLVGADVGRARRFASFREELEAAIPAELRDRFHFHGHVDPSALPQFALAATLAVIPSRAETFCLAAHELNWIGLPLVVSDLPAFTRYFRDGDTCRVFDGTVPDLVRVIGELLDSAAPFAGWAWRDVIGAPDSVSLYGRVLADCRPPLAPPAIGEAESPLVSVVIPFYEMQAYVDEALASVMASTYLCWEILVVDDGSRTLEARHKLTELRARFAGDPRIRIVEKPNGGLGSARNHGIAHATGRYVVSLDSDDMLHPEYLERAVRALEAAPELDAVSSFVSYFDDGHAPEEICDYVIPHDLLVPAVFLENRAGVATSVLRRAVFDRFHYDESLFSYEDWELWWQLAAAGRQLETLPRILFRYRRRPGSMVNMVGYSRHAYLVAHMASRHRDALIGRFDGVFRTYLEEIVRLREEVARVRASSRPPDTVPGDGYEYSVRRTARVLGRLLTSRVRGWAAASLGRRRVTVRIASERHAEALGGEAWCAGLRAAGDDAWRLDGVGDDAPGWARRAGRRPMLVGTDPGATLTFPVGVGGFSLGFVRHPWSGRVELTADGHSEVVDLFGSGDEEGLFDYFWTGYRWVRSRAG